MLSWHTNQEIFLPLILLSWNWLLHHCPVKRRLLPASAESQALHFSFLGRELNEPTVKIMSFPLAITLSAPTVLIRNTTILSVFIQYWFGVAWVQSSCCIPPSSSTYPTLFSPLPTDPDWGVKCVSTRNWKVLQSRFLRAQQMPALRSGSESTTPSTEKFYWLILIFKLL